MADKFVRTSVSRETPCEDQAIVRARDDLLKIGVEASRCDFLLVPLQCFQNVRVLL